MKMFLEWRGSSINIVKIWTKGTLLTICKLNYFQEIFKLNQQSSNLTEWEKIPQADKLSIAYKVDQYLFYYEPMYVAQGDTPLFDERFIGYGMTRNTQVFERLIFVINVSPCL